RPRRPGPARRRRRSAATTTATAGPAAAGPEPAWPRPARPRRPARRRPARGRADRAAARRRARRRRATRPALRPRAAGGGSWRTRRRAARRAPRPQVGARTGPGPRSARRRVPLVLRVHAGSGQRVLQRAHGGEGAALHGADGKGQPGGELRLAVAGEVRQLDDLAVRVWEARHGGTDVVAGDAPPGLLLHGRPAGGLLAGGVERLGPAPLLAAHHVDGL